MNTSGDIKKKSKYSHHRPAVWPTRHQHNQHVDTIIIGWNQNPSPQQQQNFQSPPFALHYPLKGNHSTTSAGQTNQTM